MESTRWYFTSTDPKRPLWQGPESHQGASQVSNCGTKGIAGWLHSTCKCPAVEPVWGVQAIHCGQSICVHVRTLEILLGRRPGVRPGGCTMLGDFIWSVTGRHCRDGCDLTYFSMLNWTALWRTDCNMAKAEAGTLVVSSEHCREGWQWPASGRCPWKSWEMAVFGL